MLVVLKKLIRFIDFNGKWVILPPATEVYVDASVNIACFGDHHFDLYPDEYHCLN